MLLHATAIVHSSHCGVCAVCGAGELGTPWSKGKWGALPDKPGILFADFGGAQHELSFERWPAFVSTRCADGEVVRGSMDESAG